MTRDDIVGLLAMAAAYDQRTVGQADIAAWHNALKHLPSVQDAADAVVSHYQHSRDRIMPADVIRIVKEVGNRRHESPQFRELVPPPEVRRAIEGAAPQRVPRPESTRAEVDPAMKAALRVSCPFCGARPYHGCRLDLGGRSRQRATPHPSRVEAGLR